MARAIPLSSNDDIVGGATAVVLFGIVAGLLIFVGMIMLPVAAVGLGGAYYYRNMHLPARRREEEEARTAIIEKAIENKTTISDSDFIARLNDAGIEDEDLQVCAIGFYEDEGLDPPKKPPLADTIAGARYRDQLLRYHERIDTDHVERFVKFVIDVLQPEAREVGSGIFTGKMDLP